MALFIIADQRYPRRAKENDNYETEKLAKMTRSSGVFDSSPVQRRRRPVTLDEVADSGLYLGSRKACRVSDFANEDTDDIRSKSYNKDRALLDDITNKLCRLEFDNVKIGKDVGMKTGFRRHLYGKKRAPIEKETREQRRLDRLKHPWDYTNTNNYFRPKRPEPKTKKEKAEAKEREKRRPLWLKSERKEPTKPADPYPEYDPLGLYRKREKKKRSDTEGSLTASKYEDMNPREMLANVRAKVESMPRRRDAMRDIDSLLEDVVNKPLPRSHVSEYKVLNDDDQVDPNWEYTADPGLDDRMKSKISASRGELEQFERMLDSKFGRRGQKKAAGAGAGPFYYEVPALKAPSMVPAKVDMAKGIAALERELGIADDLYVEPIPTPVHHMRQPVVVKARTNARAGYGRPRTGSLPPPDRVGRAKLQSDIEAEAEEYLERPIGGRSSAFSPRYRASSMDRSAPIRSRAISPSPVLLSSVRSRPSSLERMPALDPYRPHQGSVDGGSGGGGSYSSGVAPYQPAKVSSSGGGRSSSGLPPRAPAFRPQMSDTRRRIREVLCSTKGDPHYYD